MNSERCGLVGIETVNKSMGCELGLGDELGLKRGTVERIVRELLVSSVLYASTAEALQGLSRPTPARGRGRQVECSPLRKTFSDTMIRELVTRCIPEMVVG